MDLAVMRMEPKLGVGDWNLGGMEPTESIDVAYRRSASGVRPASRPLTYPELWLHSTTHWHAT